MNSPQKIKRVQLSATGFDDSVLIGLVCSDPDYKLSLKINKKLGICLKSESPVETGMMKGKELMFTRFSDSLSAPDSSIHLFSNRAGSDFLLKKLRNVDYLLEIYDPGNYYDADGIILKLREIDTVTAVFNIDLKNLNDKNLKYLFL